MPRKPKLDPNIIRVGDTVEITNPVVVMRVGYPKTTDDYMAEAAEKLEPVLREWLEPGTALALKTGLNFGLSAVRFQKVFHEAAYLALKRDGFGGRERSLHTETFPALAGKRGHVLAAKTVHTGRYYPASVYEDDYEPGGLTEEKRHRLVEVQVQDGQLQRCFAPGQWLCVTDVKKIASASEYQHRLKKVA